MQELETPVSTELRVQVCVNRMEQGPTGGTDSMDEVWRSRGMGRTQPSTENCLIGR